MKRNQPNKITRARVSSKRGSAKKSSLYAKPARKKTAKRKKRIRGKAAMVEVVSFEPRGLGARSGGQSGDLQGLSGTEGAASESVEELLEEGNAYEADIVKGVEDAEDADEMEVETHEVPEDDVPREYLRQN